MNDLIVDVTLWGENVGSLYWDEMAKAAIFDYESKFRRFGLNISPLMMPINKNTGSPYQFFENRNNCFKGLPGLLADSLPDTFGNQIINEWFASRGLPSEEITPLDRLCYVGKRAMGALEFEPSNSSVSLNESSIIHVQELTLLAKSIFADRENFKVKMTQPDQKILDILKVGTSAGGAKPKAIIAYNPQTNEVRSGQVQAPEGFGYWLLKFDGGTYSEHSQIADNPQGIGNIEYAYYLMAKNCGIDMMECQLLPEGDSNHFMTKRFDRTETGDKIHVQTLAGIAHYDRDKRHSYEEAFRVSRTLKLSYPEQEQLFRRMVFNVVARNHDDHTKNFSFLMDTSGKWTLAPAYDLCYSYSPGGTWTNRHQMSLNGKQDNFTYADIIAVAENMGIRNSKSIIEQTVESVSNWKQYAKDSGVKEKHVYEIEDNLRLLISPTAHVAVIQDQALKTAIINQDFIKLLELKEKGYKLSPDLLKSLETSLPPNVMIAICKIFDIEKHATIEDRVISKAEGIIAPNKEHELNL